MELMEAKKHPAEVCSPVQAIKSFFFFFFSGQKGDTLHLLYVCTEHMVFDM